MTKVVDSSEYSANSIFVGCSVNEDGEPLVEINGKAIGTVAGLLDFLGKYEGQHKATVNVKWAAAVPPDGFLRPRDYKVASPHRAAAFLMDVPVDAEPPVRIIMKAGQVVAIGDDDGRTRPAKPVVVSDGVLYLDDIKIKSLSGLSKHLANVEIKDACISPLLAGSTNIESSDDRLSILESKVEELDCQINRQIEYGIRVLEKRTLRDAQ